MSNVPKNSLFIGIGISLIGFIDFKSDSWVFTARWPLIRNLKFSELSALSHKPLTIKRALDCEMETLISSTKSLQDKDVLLIHWGYGIGAAFAEKGKVVKTNIGGFCEFGHWQGFTNNKSLCSCGSIGCLEASAALWSLIPRLKKDFPDAPEDEDIFYDYLRKHKTIVHHPEIQDAILNMAKSIAQLYTIFFPQRILIYGPMSDNNYIFESLKTNIVELIPFFSRKYFSFEQLRTNNKGQVLASVSELFLDMYKKTLNAR
jgi:transcriptional regulator of PTS gene